MPDDPLTRMMTPTLIDHYRWRVRDLAAERAALLRELVWVRRQLHYDLRTPGRNDFSHQLCKLGYSDLIGEELLILAEMQVLAELDQVQARCAGAEPVEAMERRVDEFKERENQHIACARRGKLLDMRPSGPNRMAEERGAFSHS